jgi:putative transposase
VGKTYSRKERTTLTEDNMARLELVETHGDGESFGSRASGPAADHELEAESRCGAQRHERSSVRVNRRNGHRDRDFETRSGRLELRVPKLRVGSYYPSILEPQKAAEHALVGVVEEAYVKGVSTRSVDDLVKALGMTRICESQVSRLCAELDGRVRTFLNRPLKGTWLYVWLDATYPKGREDRQVENKAVVVAVGVNGEGRREVLGLACGPAETEAFWTTLLRDLTKRGLAGVKLVISDAHQGPKKAAAKVLAPEEPQALIESSDVA